MLRKVIVKRGKFMYRVVTICSSKWTLLFALWIPNSLFSGMKHSFVWLLRMLKTAFSQLGLPWNINLSWNELPSYRKTPFLAGSAPPMTGQKTVERAWPPCFHLGNSAWLSQLQSSLWDWPRLMYYCISNQLFPVWLHQQLTSSSAQSCFLNSPQLLILKIFLTNIPTCKYLCVRVCFMGNATSSS